MALDKLTRISVFLKGKDLLSKPLRKAQESTKDLARQIYETRQRIKEIDATNKNIKGFQALKKKADQSANTLNKQRQVTRRLAQELKATERPTKAFRDALKEARQRSQELRYAHRKNIATLKNLKPALKAANIDTRNLANAESELNSETHKLNAALINCSILGNALNPQQSRSAYSRAILCLNSLVFNCASALGSAICNTLLRCSFESSSIGE